MTSPLLPDAVQEQLQRGATAQVDLTAAMRTISILRDELAAIRDIAYRAGPEGRQDALEAIHARVSRAAAMEA